MRLLLFVCFSFLNTFLFAQGSVLTPLSSNSELKLKQYTPSLKRALTDTLELPFMDDFTSTMVYPDMRIWKDSLVYINSTFSVSPPSFGVATFDNLDKKGKPYRPLSGFTNGPSDSLTSNFINTKNYLSGFNMVDYVIADSIYLSFFYQAQGLGDILDGSDSLVLKFRDTGGDWRTVWKTTGSSVKPFKQVLIGLKNIRYFTKDFQFRFINYTKNTGNLNQWHVDYIRMAAGRNSRDTLVNDVAINAVPIGPLKFYESMPYSHYKANSAFNTLEYHSVQIRNNFNTGVNVQYQAEIRDKGNNLIANYPLSANARNIARFSDSSEKFPQFAFDNMTGTEPIIRMKYTINPLSNDFDPGNYNSLGNNNVVTKNVYFRNYFAYDDGSAEGGYGLDYGSLPSGPGYSAIKFQSFHPDTLRGISVFFNRSVSDVGFKSYTFMVWQNISEPPAINMNNDVILKRMDMSTTVYSDSINGFIDFIFDTAVILPQGKFFIGWQQTGPFILNVGYDNNYKFAKEGGRNPNLFFNLNGYWEKVSPQISGAVMMRPLVGREIKRTSSLKKVVSGINLNIYPNPSGENNELFIDCINQITNVVIIDFAGRIVDEINAENILSVNFSNLDRGYYNLVFTDNMNNRITKKFIRN